MSSSILIVDDSHAMRAVLERAIRLSGLPVSACYQAAHGGEALALLHRHPIDFMLLDVHMPEMGAEELILRWRSQPGAAPIPFLVTSADASAPRIERLLELGACDYLTKPFPLSVLCSRLGQALNNLHDRN
ncbi:MAG TPA: response regulator [Bryobacteraceae bacterium]